MKKIAVVHYMPLEFYPPVTNFLDNVTQTQEFNVKVFSTKNNKNRREYDNFIINKIHRSSFPEPSDNTIVRLYKYLVFNINCFLRLISFNPEEILYYETYSAGPVYLYLRLFGRNKKLKIHYHEYFPEEWYRDGMLLNRKYHEFEKKYLYRKADWISQTNIDRVNLFLQDQPEVDPQKMMILPNYPPASWGHDPKQQKKENSVIRTVYIGSLSLEATFIREYCVWVIEQKGAIAFDIYAYNLHHDTIKYLVNLNSPYIKFNKEGVDYEDIPCILQKYDVGLILYKAFTENYKYNAPNKLFEYMACGLEVWFSLKMEGCLSYKRSNFPRILPVDFLNPDSDLLLNFKKIKLSSKNEEFIYTADRALDPLIKNLSN